MFQLLNLNLENNQQLMNMSCQIFQVFRARNVTPEPDDCIIYSRKMH